MPNFHTPRHWINAAGEQVGVDEERDLIPGELERASDDQRNRNRAGVHHQYML
jgi:hypothetical protein